jgi:hypothetical protein
LTVIFLLYFFELAFTVIVTLPGFLKVTRPALSTVAIFAEAGKTFTA